MKMTERDCHTKKETSSSADGPPDGDDGNNPSETQFNLAAEARQLLEIAIPTALVQLSLFAIFPQTASAIGRRIGSEELAGFSLASLAMNMTCLSIILGILTAADTLQPRAMALGRYEEVGVLAIRGYAVCALALLVPVMVLGTLTEPILVALGQDPVAARLACEWSRIFILGIPFVVLFRDLQRFQSAQHDVLPMAIGGVIGTFLFHPLALKVLVGAYSFPGSAFAVVLTQIVHSFVPIGYLYWKKPVTWPGVTRNTIKLALNLQEIINFFKLGLGGILSFAVRSLSLNVGKICSIDLKSSC